MKRESFIQGLSYLLICLWIYASLSKLVEYPVFLDELGKQPFPKWSTSSIAIILPVVEISAALLLGFQKTKITGFKLSFILMALFTLYVLLALTRAFGRIPCPCAGIIGRMSWLPHLFFNLFFILVSYVGYYRQKRITMAEKGSSKLQTLFADKQANNLTPDGK